MKGRTDEEILYGAMCLSDFVAVQHPIYAVCILTLLVYPDIGCKLQFPILVDMITITCQQFRSLLFGALSCSVLH